MHPNQKLDHFNVVNPSVNVNFRDGSELPGLKRSAGGHWRIKTVEQLGIMHC